MCVLSSAKYDLLIVVPCSGWTPHKSPDRMAFLDEPPSCEVQWIDAHAVDHSTAEGALFGFNTAAMHDELKAWMIARPTRDSIESGNAQPAASLRGDHCHV